MARKAGMHLIQQLTQIGIVPVIKVARAQDAVPLCRALAEGGLPVAEITFRTDAAEEAIRLVNQELPEVLLGAGTVLTTQKADRAWQAGARFLVSPGMNPQVVRHCMDKGYTILPGCASPADIEQALALGLDTVKMFPAEALGGTAFLKALLGPYSGMRFVPTGGINEQNLMDWLSIPQVIACGGSWMVPVVAVESQDWDRIRDLARQAVDAMMGMEVRHVGVNLPDQAQGDEAAQQLSALTGWPILGDTPINCFVGAGFEVMKGKGRGHHGHVALAVNDLPRARWQMERRGYRFIEESLVLSPDGRPKLIYFQDEIAGFALHLVQK